jgi:hypothetical protein
MSEHEDQVGSPTQEEHVVSCIKAIYNYREHNISKWEAVAQISTALWSPTASVNNDQRATAGETYLAMLDEHDQMLADASSHGHQGLDQVDSENSEQEGLLERLSTAHNPGVAHPHPNGTRLMSCSMHGRSQKQSHLPLSHQISSALTPWCKTTQLNSNTLLLWIHRIFVCMIF